MATVLPATWILFLVASLITTGNAQSGEICKDPSGATYESANCDFEKNSCEWNNTEGNEILWQRQTSGLLNIFNGYMCAAMSDARPGSVARLASPWFRATENQQCTLQFQYYFGQNDSCQLSVYLDNDTSSTELFWQTARSTGRDFQEIDPIRLPHSNCRHRIIFEAKKLRDGRCGYYTTFGISYNEVDIDNIKFHCSSPLTTTTAAGGRTVTTPSSLSAGVSPTGTTAASPSTTTMSSPHLISSAESLSAVGSGAVDTKMSGTGKNIQLITGIVIAVVVVVVVVMVIVYCRITNKHGAICGKNPKSRNNSSNAASQDERGGTADRTNADGSSHQDHNVDTADASVDTGRGSDYYQNVDTVRPAPPLESRAGDNTHRAEDNYGRMQPGASQTTDEPYEALTIDDDVMLIKDSRKCAVM